MSVLGRLIAFIGVLLVGTGLFMPAVCADEGECKVIENGLLAPERFDADADEGIIVNLYGLLAVVIALPALIAVATGDRTSVTVSALGIVAITGVNFAHFFITVDDLTSVSLSWGWLLSGGGCVLLLLSTLFKAVPQMIVPAAMVAAGAAGPVNLQKTMIEAPGQARVAAPGKPPGMLKTMIDAGFGLRRQPQQPPPAIPGQAPYGLDGLPIDPLKKTMVEGIDSALAAPPPPAVPTAGSPFGFEMPDPLQATLVSPPQSAKESVLPSTPSIPRPEPTVPDIPEDLKKTMVEGFDTPPTPPAASTPPARPSVSPAAAKAQDDTPESGIQRSTPPSGSRPVQPPPVAPPRRSKMADEMERTNIVPIHDPVPPEPPAPTSAGFGAINAAERTMVDSPLARNRGDLPSSSGSPSGAIPAGAMDPAEKTMIQPDRPSQAGLPPRPPESAALHKTMVGQAESTPPSGVEGPAKTALPADDPLQKTMMTGMTPPSSAPMDDALFKTMLQMPAAPKAEPEPPSAPPAMDDALFKTMLQMPAAPKAEPEPPPAPPAMDESLFKTMISDQQRTPPPASSQHDLTPRDETDADDEDTKPI